MGQKSPFEFNFWETEQEKKERYEREHKALFEAKLTPEQKRERKEREKNFIDEFSEKFKEIFKGNKEAGN